MAQIDAALADRCEEETVNHFNMSRWGGVGKPEVATAGRCGSRLGHCPAPLRPAAGHRSGRRNILVQYGPGHYNRRSTPHAEIPCSATLNVQFDGAITSAALSVMALLFLASILSVVTRRLKLPFALTLLGVGLLLGLVVGWVPQLEPLASVRLSGELLTYILLPTLVFNAAFAMNSRELGQNVLPVLVLAIPATFVCFVAAGFGIHWSIGLPLGAALLFGALISSTDSTAVLAIFQELGAPKRLSVIVEGENLFNDAAAIVVFQIVAGAVGIGIATQAMQGDLVRAGAMAFFTSFVGGLAFGALVGHLVGRLLVLIENDDLVEILLTTTVVYLTFMAAELLFGISGVMAVVATGLVLGSSGVTRYSQPTLEYLDRYWQYLAFVAHSLIFLLIGVHLATDWPLVQGMAWPIAVAVGVALLARAVSIFGLFPLVNRLPAIEKVDTRSQAVIVWGGLRGALSLVLAMSLPLDYAYRAEILALTIGVVVFSLVVQGLTLEPLMRRLGLQQATAPELYVREEGLLSAKRIARARISELRRQGMFSDRVTNELEQTYSDEESAIRQKIEALRHEGRLGTRERFRLLKREYLLVEKRIYQDLFHRGQLSERVLRELQHSIELQIDHLRYGIMPAWTIHSPSRWKAEAALFRTLEALMPWTPAVQRFRLNRIADLYEQHWGRLVASHEVIQELERIERNGTNSPELVRELRELYGFWNENARHRLDAVNEQFPEYATKVQQIMATRLCLQAEEEVIADLQRLNVLPEREAATMRGDVAEKLRRLRQKPLEELRPRPAELLAKVPFLRTLPGGEFDSIVKLLRPRTFLAEDIIVREGETGDSMFLIGRGVVRVSLGRGSAGQLPIATLLAGEFFGEIAVLSAGLRTATVTAVTHCTLYELTRGDLEAVATVATSVAQVLETSAAERTARLTARV
jgi:monovalent cation:H+ antiporter, CPA1 family